MSNLWSIQLHDCHWKRNDCTIQAKSKKWIDTGSFKFQVELILTMLDQCRSQLMINKMQLHSIQQYFHYKYSHITMCQVRNSLNKRNILPSKDMKPNTQQDIVYRLNWWDNGLQDSLHILHWLEVNSLCNLNKLLNLNMSNN
mgnify:CR=1 FL=1